MNRTLTPLEFDAARVYATLSRGGLALVPTDVGYGLLMRRTASSFMAYEFKGRPLTKPCVTVPATILNLTTGRFQRQGVNFEQIERSWQTDRARDTSAEPLALSA